MEVIEFRPEREQYTFTFGGVAPVRKIQPGTMLRLWTEDAFCGNIRQVTDLPGAALTMPFVNPQAGQFQVAGAEPGDTLALHFVDLSPARSFGASGTIPLWRCFRRRPPTAERTARPARPPPSPFRCSAGNERAVLTQRAWRPSVRSGGRFAFPGRPGG